jgi:hypothetical protein
VLERSSVPPTSSGSGVRETAPRALGAGLGGAVAAGPERKGPAGNAALLGAVIRLEEIVDQETAALKARAAVDLKVFNDRKNQMLLELSRALRTLPGAGGNDAALAAQLGSLRRKLEINRSVLKMHVEAVREISTTLADAIRDADSDGTYSQAIRAAPKRQ